MTDKISDNVGKKIVEALKMQSAGNVSSPVKSTQSNDIKISNVKEDEVSTPEDINDSLETEQKPLNPRYRLLYGTYRHLALQTLIPLFKTA